MKEGYGMRSPMLEISFSVVISLHGTLLIVVYFLMRKVDLKGWKEGRKRANTRERGRKKRCEGVTGVTLFLSCQFWIFGGL